MSLLPSAPSPRQLLPVRRAGRGSTRHAPHAASAPTRRSSTSGCSSSPAPARPALRSRAEALHRLDPVVGVQRGDLVGLRERRVVEDGGHEEVEPAGARRPSRPARCGPGRSRWCRARARPGRTGPRPRRAASASRRGRRRSRPGRARSSARCPPRRGPRRRSAAPRCSRPSPAPGSRRRRSGSAAAAASPAGRTRAAPRSGPAPSRSRPARRRRRSRRRRRCAAPPSGRSSSTLIRPRLSASRPGLAEPELLRVALAAGGVEHRLGHDLLARGELQPRAAALERLDRVDLLAQPERHVAAAQQVLERLADLGVEEATARGRAGRRPSPWTPARRTSTRTRRRSRPRRRRSSSAARAISSFSSPSESMIVRSSNSTDAGRAGRVPDRDHDPVRADRLVGAVDADRVVVLEARRRRAAARRGCAGTARA